jgi:ADP-ribosylglycohydrolase
LLGVHADDSLGATLEFLPWQAIRARYPEGLRDIVGGGPFGWPAGHATDDTDLTRAVLLAYLTPGHADIVRAAADNMLAWLNGDGPGRATSAGQHTTAWSATAAAATRERLEPARARPETAP